MIHFDKRHGKISVGLVHNTPEEAEKWLEQSRTWYAQVGIRVKSVEVIDFHADLSCLNCN